MTLQVLPAIDPTKSGVDVTLRQRYPAGVRASLGTKVMLNSILRGLQVYVDPQKHLKQSDLDPSAPEIVVGKDELSGTETDSVVHRTTTVESPEKRNKPTNPDKVVFISFADPSKYGTIDSELARIISAGLLEITATALVA